MMKRGRESGHTLIELLVVTTLMSLVTSLIAQVWRPLSHSTYEMRAQTVGLAEQRLALEFLRQDLGIAKQVLIETPQQLLIHREAESLRRIKQLRSDESDPGVRYRFSAGVLMREDLHTGEQFAVTYELHGFEAKQDTLGRTHIELVSSISPEPQSLELVWSR